MGTATLTEKDFTKLDSLVQKYGLWEIIDSLGTMLTIDYHDIKLSKRTYRLGQAIRDKHFTVPTS